MESNFSSKNVCLYSNKIKIGKEKKKTEQICYENEKVANDDRWK